MGPREMSQQPLDACPLCATPGGALLWRDDRLRVVRVEEPDYPGFCRVIWNAHVKEMTDLPTADRGHLMGVVFVVEAALRSLLCPAKINLASLGNVTPHLHWHVIPRWRDDAHFPGPIWGERLREGSARSLPDLDATLRDRLVAGFGGRVPR
jgi:diadenosine tetraphosphate (Ap4A) HIT family hydrolase